MRAFWSGSIAFGLVNIPVRVFSGADDKGLDLDMLHRKDLSKIRYARVCEAEGKEVPYNQIVKGFDIGGGQYVVLTPEDYQAANVRKTKALEIFSFVAQGEIDATYFEKPYYLEAGKGAGRPYALLVRALQESGKVALATFVFRNRERLGVVRPFGDYLVLNQIRYQEQIRDISQLVAPEHRVAKKELDMALTLIELLTGAFEPEKYHDTYTEDLERVIREKAKGLKPKRLGEEPKATRVNDLMDALRQSLEERVRPQAKPATKAAQTRQRASRAAKTAPRRRATARGKARRRQA